MVVSALYACLALAYAYVALRLLERHGNGGGFRILASFSDRTAFYGCWLWPLTFVLIALWFGIMLFNGWREHLRSHNPKGEK